MVKKGQTVATIENVQQEANVAASRLPSTPPRTDIVADLAAEKTAQANVEHAKADLEQKQLDWQRAQDLYKDGIMAKQDFDAKKAAYDTDVAAVDQAVAARIRPRRKPIPYAAPADAAGHAARQPERPSPYHGRRPL